ncbi:class I SAM-dependent methyltransferase [Streptomyces sp. NPDC002185]|uniref:class I SAM-dependent methyltransferase n=1 Tax=Streptomyces sp. NPDC002185 TaxID=3364636 RepID=UPI00369C3ADA
MIDQASPWYAYAEQSPHSPGPSVVARRMEWGTRPGTGPDAQILGPSLSGRRLLELGCGNGRNAAHLARVHGADVTAIDSVEIQVRRADENYGAVPGVRFLPCDALRFLRGGAMPFDTVYSVFGAVGLIAPERLLPSIARRLRAHGRLVFSVPHPRRRGRSLPPPGSPRQDFLELPDGTRRPLARWELDAAGWDTTLHRFGFRPLGSWELRAPRGGWPTALVISARRM